ncbi:alpha/beta hydrolase, partial [Conexibacter sp. JD483]|uniref:alpha/beta hydrolase n=3 Tax=unclassified Conexibacter TaxID=2627773 RepID=UPI0028702E90
RDAARHAAAGAATARDAAAGCSGRRVLRDLATVAQALRHRPVTVPLGGGRTLRIDEQALAATAYDAALAPELYTLLPSALRQATAGRAEPLLTLVAQIQVAFAGLFSDGTVSLALNSATACRDYPVAYDRAAPPAIRKRQFARALRAAGTRPFAPFSPQAWIAAVGDGGDSCIDWPDVSRGDDPTAGAERPAVPTLVLEGDLDTNTPSSAGRLAARQFPGARFVELRNVAHTATDDTTGCALAIATRFIRTGATGDTACARRIPPLRVG